MPIFVFSKFDAVAKQSRTLYGTHGVMSDLAISKVLAPTARIIALPLSTGRCSHRAAVLQVHDAVPYIQAYSKMLGNEIKDGDQVVFVSRRPNKTADGGDGQRLMFRTAVVGDPLGTVELPQTMYPGQRTIFYRSTKVSNRGEWVRFVPA